MRPIMVATRTALPILATAVLAAIASAQGAASKPEFPYSMDFGPCMTTTMTSPGVSKETHKALVVKLQNGAAAFDTELLRMSSMWTDGWLELRGTAYDGSHGPMPSTKGREIAGVRQGPGIAHAGSLADPRSIPYGPLPKSWGAYEGHWMCGNEVVFGYRIGTMRTLEHAAIEEWKGSTVAARSFEFAPSDEAHTVVLLDAPADGDVGLLKWAPRGRRVRGLALQWSPAVAEPVEAASVFGSWEDLPMGGPSDADYLDAKNGTGASIAFVPGFRRPQTAKKLAEGQKDAAADLLLPRLCDGAAAKSADDASAFTRFEPRSGDARMLVDLGKSVPVSRVSTFTWHDGDRAPQKYELYGSAADASPDAAADDPAASGWTLLGAVDTNALGRGGKHGASVHKNGGLGAFRRLLFVVHSSGSLLSEVDVFADSFRAPCDQGSRQTRFAAAAAVDGGDAVTLRHDGARVLMDIAPHRDAIRCKVLLAAGLDREFDAFDRHANAGVNARDLTAMVAAGDTKRWGAPIVTKGQRGDDDGAYAVDTIAIPFDNRFGSNMRVCGFDFFADGRAAITTWNGDVWIVAGLDEQLQNVQWSRFATGLYDPLGLRIVDEVVYVHGRDGITRLVDRNQDGEADAYECFNHDECVTNAFHEFAFELQTDPEGNFYTSKGAPVNPGGRGFMTIAPHHGTIMKVKKDGSALEVIATGLRAPNGIGVSPDGKVITSGDNEGTYMPRCRLNWIEKPGYYAGVRPTAQRDDASEQPDLPLCWMPMDIDNSSGGQVWVTSDRWGPLQGRLLHLSYGTCGLYLVCKEDRADSVQGGIVRFPLSFSSSLMRARFHPIDGQLYVAGFQGWQTSAARIGGFHRVRYTQKPLRTVTALRTCDKGVYLTFSEPLDAEVAGDKENYGLEIWDYLYSPNYGSPEISILNPERKVEQGKQNRDPLPIAGVTVSQDRRTVFLQVTGMRPVMQMKVTWNVDAADGGAVRGELHNSIHVLGSDPGMPAAQSGSGN
jgi:hypothetical protein